MPNGDAIDDVPNELKEIIDRVVDAIAVGRPYDAADGQTVVEWLEQSDYVQSYGGSEPALWLHTGHLGSWSDQDVRDHLDLDESARISDQARLECAREWARHQVASGTQDADYHPAILTVNLQSAGGQTVVVGISHVGYSTMGVRRRIHGLFSNVECFENSLRADGYIQSTGELTDQMILERWVDRPRTQLGVDHGEADTSIAPAYIAAWHSKADATVPVQNSAVLACVYTIRTAVDDVDEAIFFARDAGTDALWSVFGFDETDNTLLAEAPATLGDALAQVSLEHLSVWCSVRQSAQGEPRASCLAMLQKLVRARRGHGSPTHVRFEGIVRDADLQVITKRLAEQDDARVAEGERFRNAPIIQVATQLGLAPEHSGGSPPSWLARCPRGQHSLMINADSGDWGCGYCRLKGNASEFEAFVTAKRTQGDRATMEVLMSGELSTMVSSWTVYLCLEQCGGEVVLSNRQYEALAESHEYEVETETGDVDYELPEFIDGKKVIGMDDDMIVGGDLDYYAEEDVVRLTSGEIERARAWLVEHGWDRQPGFEESWTKIRTALDK